MADENEQKREEVARWYCLRTQPKREHIAATALRRLLGIEVACPRIRFKKPTARGAVWFTEAMFPGYLFARFHLWEKHRQVIYSPGVSAIVQFKQQFAVIEDAVIASLLENTDASEIIEIAYALDVGQTVRIVEGPFNGLCAVVTRVLSARDRIRVLLEFLGRTIEAEIAQPAVLPDRNHPLAA